LVDVYPEFRDAYRGLASTKNQLNVNELRQGARLGATMLLGPDKGELDEHGRRTERTPWIPESELATFEDPDANSWLLQEVTDRLPGRTDPDITTFNSTGDLAAALRRAKAPHGEHEKRIGRADPDWPDWYAEYMVREQNGQELPL
jgi:hypothetical protein